MHHTTKRTVTARAAVGALALVAAACSSGATSTNGSSGSPPTVPAPTTSRPAPPATTTAVATAVATTSSTAATSSSGSTATTGAATATTAAATTAPPAAPAGPALDGLSVTLTKVAELPDPIAMAVRAGDPLVYVASKAGIVYALEGDGPKVLLDISGDVSTGGEQGLLGLAFAPDGTHVYLSFTDTSGTSTLIEYGWVGGRPDRSTRRTVLTQAQPYANHNGGNIVFGPDGELYYGFGDGGSANDPQRRAQKLDTLLGKMLRIDPREQPDAPYGVPADNPLVAQDGTRSEIWSWGLRNPWRFSFDRANGDLWVGDVGQGAIEEVDHAAAADGGGRGVDYGWSAWEGTHRFNQDVDGDGATPPVHEYSHGDLGCSITGGYLYRGAKIAALAGAYVFGDYCAAGIRAIDPAAPETAVKINGGPKNLASFGQDADGELYALSLDDVVYRIDPA